MLKKALSIFLLFTLVFSVILARNNPAGQVFNQNQEEIQLPILMYHGITDKWSRLNDYFVLKSTFEKDLAYLKSKGYHTVTSFDLVQYVDGKGELPDKPIMITFDDGYFNNYTYAYPLLKKYKMKALISVIGLPCDTASKAEYKAEDYCNMTWAQIDELSKSNLVEIGNHTWNLHGYIGQRKGASSYPGEDEKSYQNFLKKDLSKLQAQLKKSSSKEPIAFAWPYGFTSASAKAVFDALGIRVTLTSRAGISTIKKGEPQSLFNLKRLLRTPNSSLEKLLTDD